MKVQVHWHDPYIISVKDLLYNHECDEITKKLVKELNMFAMPKDSLPKWFEWEDVRVMKKYDFCQLLLYLKLSIVTQKKLKKKMKKNISRKIY